MRECGDEISCLGGAGGNAMHCFWGSIHAKQIKINVLLCVLSAFSWYAVLAEDQEEVEEEEEVD